MDVRPLLTGAQTAVARIERILASLGPTRAQVIGPAGSGKTVALELFQSGLTAQGRKVHLYQDRLDVAALPAEEVLIVDDLHVLAPERTELIRDRAATPDAGLVIALRPWPRDERVTAIVRLLQRSSPPVVLGEISHGGVVAHARGQGRAVPGPCIEGILDLTGGSAWLVSFALSGHHADDCRGGEDHLELRRDLDNQVLQRLDTLEMPLRRFIERLSLSPDDGPPPVDGEDALEDLVCMGYAEGLLFRDGRPLPVVRSAVLSSGAHRWSHAHSMAVAEEIARRCLEAEGSMGTLLDALWDPRTGDAIAARADRILDHSPEQAGRLYDIAISVGTEPATLALRRARASWATGDLTQAALLVDDALRHADSHADPGLVDVAASVWAARDMMSMAAQVYGARTYDRATAVRARIARIGSGHPDPRREPAEPPTDHEVPSQLDVALHLLDRGLVASVEGAPSPTALSDLVRASELYTTSGTVCPIPELPAVVAASAALGVGELATARMVLDAAVAGGQGGQWARRRLLLWQGLVAIQGERPADARRSYLEARQQSAPVSARDARLGNVLEVTLARRFEDLAALQASWAGIRGAVANPDVDLYTLFPLATMVGAAARLGDSTTLAPHVRLGLELLHRLDSPPMWSTHLWWAGIQQGILLNTPELLAPFAKALVGAADRSPLAATMATAGSVWVQVLAGKVDADEVEHAARSLGAAGLAWDGGRLAAHAARRITDRRVAARLLSCARDLHPKERATAEPHMRPAPVTSAGADEELSEREREVARLIVRGKTYVEIGESIFISPRTVEHHVAHMRRRLKAGSRSDLIAKLRLVLDAVEVKSGSAGEPEPESPRRKVRV